MKKYLLVVAALAVMLLTGCKKEKENAPTPLPEDMFCFTALEDGLQVSMQVFKSAEPHENPELVYSTDGTTWNDFTVGTTKTEPISKGTKIYFKAKKEHSRFGMPVQNPGDELFVNEIYFVLSKRCNVSGNINYLLNGENPAAAKPDEGAFTCLFESCATLVDASGLVLPIENLPSYCYMAMFVYCEELQKAPSFAAVKSVALSGCDMMFAGCTSLQVAPELPAATVGKYGYYGMFSSCCNLTTAPKVLPAKNVSENAYNGMFYECKKLATAPELQFTTVEAYGCNAMFAYCESLRKSPVLSAQTLSTRSYSGIFKNCINMDTVTCLATDFTAEDCILNWMDSVAATGTFMATPGTDWTGKIPEGWTVVELDE